MSKLQASPFTPRAKEIADPFPLNGQCAWGPSKAHQLPTDIILPTASLPAGRPRPGPTAVTTTNHSAPYKDRLRRASKQTGLTAQTFPVPLGRALAPGQETPAKTIKTPTPHHIHARQKKVQKPSW